MDTIKILKNREKPYPHDYVTDKLILWMFPYTVKPNHITIFRLFATPIVLFFVVKELWIIAIIIFLILALTDAIDGSMARIRGQITVWGTLFDPVADKILISSILFVLLLKYINIYISIAIILLELIVVVGALIKKQNGIVISACRFGKIKMVTHVLGISCLMLGLFMHSPGVLYLSEWILIFAIIFSILSIINNGLVTKK